MEVKVSSTPSENDRGGADDHTSNLSEYEKLRLQKIKRNEDRMKELGLFRTKEALKKKKTGTKKEKTSRVSPELPQRRSSRKRKSVANYSAEQVIPMYSDEEDLESDRPNTDDEDEIEDAKDDYEISDNDNDDDSDREDEDESYLKPKPQKKRKRSEVDKPSDSGAAATSKSTSTRDSAIDTTSFDCVNPKGGLTLEYAKTGRSKCRKCRNPIEKGKPRVGMEAWIVGRNCITWQCPECLLDNLCCAYEKSGTGKGKCKSTHRPFAKGKLKVGIRCHTATSYYHVGAVVDVLNNVVDLMVSDRNKSYTGFELSVDSIDGTKKLSPEDRAQLASVLQGVSPNRDGPASKRTATPVGASEKAKKNASPRTGAKAKADKGARMGSQPSAGAKTNARGRVEWKFGGRTCYGTLLPSMETKTHCYARTQRGNTKTLAKGKDYWSVLA
ncbi:unnamed protein product [Pseudo-nitzschia multistriata]|uniref:PARP-type domain-containing protein n=1 Tax=Pseudo-nitzschia multistriata TaxID=183589 RepID=A0A448ZR68_9STRA|nr:unnamed protein product [Pseudo-nitzschia multistriata]